MNDADVAIIGAGYGGLSAALTLAEAGVKVKVLEALNYPGGCASTFTRDGYAFESGATLFNGFQPGQLFHRWIERHGLDVTVHTHDPVMTVHLGDTTLEVPRDKAAWVDQLAAAAGPRGPGVRAFFAEQTRAADALWEVLGEPDRLPPLSPPAWLWHARHLPAHLSWARWIGRPLLDVARRHGVHEVQPLRTWLDAICQITVQTTADRAEAPFALAAIDFLFRGAATVEGGIGRFGHAVVGAIRGAGGEVALSHSVRGLRWEDGAWSLRTRGGPVRAPIVLANTLPQTVAAWLGRTVEPELCQAVERGWGAVCLYAVVDDRPDLAREAIHHQFVCRPGHPPVEGNGALVTLSEARAGLRSVTVSTHIHMNHPPLEVPERVAQIQAQLRALLARLDLEIRHELPASPRTFERFTRRHRGFVGGVPRLAGLSHYRSAFDHEPVPGLYLIGDSAFPGQSTLAAATSGHRAATRVLARLGRR